MSRIGKMPIAIPAGVTVEFKNGVVTVNGPKGTLSREIVGNIGIETGLSFLGFGLPPTTPSLGTLIGYAASPDVIENKTWVWLPASLLILVLMLSINYVGQALQRAADSKQRLG